MTFGKVMGGGFPAAAFAGRTELMQHLAPVGVPGGHASGNPVATAAGLATLRLATDDVYACLDHPRRSCGPRLPVPLPQPVFRTSSKTPGTCSASSSCPRT